MREISNMQRWAIGVFTSVDAGLGVHLDVAHELKIPTVQIHAPHQQTRTAENAKAVANSPMNQMRKRMPEYSTW